MSAEAPRVTLPRVEVFVSATARIAVLAVRRPGTPGLGLWVGVEARSPSDVSSAAYCVTGRGFPLALHHAEALAQEIVSVARRASEVGLWEPMEIPTPDDAA